MEDMWKCQVVADIVDIQLQPLMSSDLLAVVVSLSATSKTTFVRLPFVHWCALEIGAVEMLAAEVDV